MRIPGVVKKKMKGIPGLRHIVFPPFTFFFEIRVIDPVRAGEWYHTDTDTRPRASRFPICPPSKNAALPERYSRTKEQRYNGKHYNRTNIS